MDTILPVLEEVDIKYSSVDASDADTLVLGSVPARMYEVDYRTQVGVGLILLSPCGGKGGRYVGNEVRRFCKSVHEFWLGWQSTKPDRSTVGIGQLNTFWGTL